MKILTIDIGGKSIKYTIFKNNKKMFDVKYVNIKESNKEEVLSIIKNIYDKNNDNISGIAVSSPGSIISSGFINGITSIKGFDNFNLIKTLKEKLKFTGEIKIINDGNASAYADYSTVEKGSSIASIVVGTGIGSGIIINGNLITGKDGFGGEVGMMTAFANYKYNDDFKITTGSMSSGFYNTEKYYEKLTGISKEGKDIFELYDEENKNSLIAIERMYKGIAILIFNIAVTINPDYIFIGGGLSKRKSAAKEINKYVKQLHKNLELRINLIESKNSSFNSEGQLWGAYKYFLDNI